MQKNIADSLLDVEKTRIKKDEEILKITKWFGKNYQLIILALPILIFTLIIKYIPMLGVLLAFKDFRFNLGAFNSPWIGFENFEFFLNSPEIFEVTRNTLLYNFSFIIINTVLGIILALLLNTVKKKYALKFYQTSMFLPFFLSYVVVGFIVLAFLNSSLGIMNRIFDIDIQWYQDAKLWVFILPIVQTWKSIGYSTLFYYASLLGISKEYYEAAEIDGATGFKKSWHISLPFLKPVAVVLVLISIGNIFRADFGLFYMVPQQELSPLIYSTTDVIDTYVFRALKINAEIGMSSAVGFFQSTVGFAALVICNWVVKKINSGDGLF